MTLSELLRDLEEITGYAVSLHTNAPVFFDSPALQLAPDQYIHHSPACRKYKLISGNLHCAGNKNRSLRIAALGRSFCGKCPNGIWELAMPVIDHGELMAVIYLGGREGQNPTPEVRRQLREELRVVRRFVQLELRRIFITGKGGIKMRDGAFYLASARRFLDLHYAGPVSLTDLAEALRVTPNYLGALLKKATGENFHTMLNTRRIQEAKIILAWQVDVAVGEVARRCGFADRNYFAVVFRRITGLTPSAYRLRESRCEKPPQTIAPTLAGTGK